MVASWWIGWVLAAGAAELCDGVDDNGDGQIDEGPVLAGPDSDGDGAGSATTTELFPSCDEVPPDHLPSTDCNDRDSVVRPGAPEACNGRDDDCDGVLDQGACDGQLLVDTPSVWLGSGDLETWTGALAACGALGWHLATPSTEYEDGVMGAATSGLGDGPFWIGFTDAATEGRWDWIDGSIATFQPWAEGEPNEGSDGQDCAVREWNGEWYDRTCTSLHGYACETTCDGREWFADTDQDGLGDPNTGVRACETADGRVTNALDCDDRNPDQPRVSYVDDDGDGFGGAARVECTDRVTVGGDCDDRDATTWPGAPDPEEDGVDQDCDGSDGAGPTTTPDPAGAPGDSDGDGVVDLRDPEQADAGGVTGEAPSPPTLACATSARPTAGAAWMALLIAGFGRRRRRD